MWGISTCQRRDELCTYYLCCPRFSAIEPPVRTSFAPPMRFISTIQRMSSRLLRQPAARHHALQARARWCRSAENATRSHAHFAGCLSAVRLSCVKGGSRSMRQQLNFRKSRNNGAADIVWGGWDDMVWVGISNGENIIGRRRRVQSF